MFLGAGSVLETKYGNMRHVGGTRDDCLSVGGTQCGLTERREVENKKVHVTTQN